MGSCKEGFNVGSYCNIPKAKSSVYKGDYNMIPEEKGVELPWGIFTKPAGSVEPRAHLQKSEASNKICPKA